MNNTKIISPSITQLLVDSLNDRITHSLGHEQLSEWPIDGMNEWQNYRQNDFRDRRIDRNWCRWMTEWKTKWPAAQLTDLLSEWIWSSTGGWLNWRLNDWRTDLSDWMAYRVWWLTAWLTEFGDWLTDFGDRKILVTNWLTDRWTDWLTAQLIDRLTDGQWWLTGRLVWWAIEWLTDFGHWPIEWFGDGLNESLTLVNSWLIDWLTG